MTVYFKNYWIWQLVLDGVVDMDVGYKASDPGSKHNSGVFLFHFYIHVILLKETIWFQSMLSNANRAQVTICS